MEDEEDDEGDDAATIVVAAAAVAAVAASDVTDIAPNKLCSNVCISARITGCLLTVGKRGGSMTSTNKRAKKSHRSRLTERLRQGMCGAER